MTTPTLDELMNLAESATPGPWYDDGYRLYAPTPDEDKRNGRMLFEYKHTTDFHYPDAAFITAANPDTVLKILRDYKRMREALEEVRETSCEAYGHRDWVDNCLAALEFVKGSV